MMSAQLVAAQEGNLSAKVAPDLRVVVLDHKAVVVEATEAVPVMYSEVEILEAEAVREGAREVAIEAATEEANTVEIEKDPLLWEAATEAKKVAAPDITITRMIPTTDHLLREDLTIVVPDREGTITKTIPITLLLVQDLLSNSPEETWATEANKYKDIEVNKTTMKDLPLAESSQPPETLPDNMMTHTHVVKEAHVAVKEPEGALLPVASVEVTDVANVEATETFSVEVTETATVEATETATAVTTEAVTAMRMRDTEHATIKQYF